MSGASSNSRSREIPTTVEIPPAPEIEPRPLHKPYICNDCEKAFATSGHLTRHQRVHTGEMAYACTFPGCSTRCSRQDNLRQHYRLHFDIRDPEELKRLAPEKRRRKTRVARFATIDGQTEWTEYVPGSSGNASRRLAAASPDGSHASQDDDPIPSSHSPSASYSSDDSSISSPYGTPQSSPYTQDPSHTFALAQAQYAKVPANHNPTRHSTSESFSSPRQAQYPSSLIHAQHLPSESSPSSPSEAHYASRFASSVSRAVPAQYSPSASSPSSHFSSPSEAHYASRCASSSSRIMPAQHGPGTSSPPGSFPSVKQAQYPPLYAPSSSSRIMPAEHASSADSSSSFSSTRQPQYASQYASSRTMPSLQDLSTHTCAPPYPPQLSPPYSQSGSPHPRPQRPLRYMGTGASRSEALDNALPLSRSRHESGADYPSPIGAGSYK